MTFADYVRKYHTTDKIDSVREIVEFVNSEPDFQYITDEDDSYDVAKLLPSTGKNNEDKMYKDVLCDLFSEYERFEQLKRTAGCVSCRDVEMKQRGLLAANTLAMIDLAQAIRQGKIINEVWEL